jgi:hypothetical protein
VRGIGKKRLAKVMLSGTRSVILTENRRFRASSELLRESKSRHAAYSFEAQ